MDSLRDMRLMEKAAKAAGYGVARWSDDGRGLLLTGVQEPWNPLEDDGDALRLAVMLGLQIRHYDGDPCAATRHAIVQAAAAMEDNKTPNASGNGQAGVLACPVDRRVSGDNG